MESERLQNFNDRLNQWIASQGFWFQLRYSMLGSGSRGGAYQVFQLGFRLLIFALIVALGGLIYLVKRADGEGFRKKLEASLKEELGATRFRLGGFQHSQGKLAIPRITALGSDGTFFTELEANDIGGKMGLLDGVVGQWDPGTLTIGRLDIDLRAGAKDEAAAATLGQALFEDRPGVKIAGVDVEDATVTWGYSNLTRGMIEKSHLKARRLENGWRFQFKGGHFSQNWLSRLEIEDLVVVCTANGLLFEKARFKSGQGTLDFGGVTIKGKEKPLVEGLVRLDQLPLEGALPSGIQGFLEGSISGELKVRGSTNSLEGVGFEGRITLQEEDNITLRDRVHLLRALSVVDIYNNYRRVNFRQGSFKLKTTGGDLTLSDVNLKADDLFTLTGSMKARHPTQDEVNLHIQGEQEARSPIFAAQEPTPEAAAPDSSDFTLKRAAKESQSKEKTLPEEGLSERYEVRLEERELEAQAADRLAESLRYEGEFEVTIRSDSFERSEKLHAEFPKNEKTGRIHLKVPIEGSLYDVTLKQAEDIYVKGKR